MEQSIPTAAVYTGSLARTYEYRTIGVPTTPHLCWSFAFRPGARITCPILVSQDRVYVADSAGYLNALDASSRDLVWSFATDWVENPKKRDSIALEGVTAFCLDEKLALGYVASAHDTVYELDLPTGQVLRSWQALLTGEEDEENVFDVQYIQALFLYHDELWLFGWTDSIGRSINRFDRRTGSFIYIDIDTTPIDQYECVYPPAVYHDPTGQADLIFGFCRANNNGDTFFEAVDLSTADQEGVLWTIDGEEAIWVRDEPDNGSLIRVRRYCPPHSWMTPFWVRDEPDNGSLIRVSGTPGSLDLRKSNTPVIDGVLYAYGVFNAWEGDGWVGVEALLAFDPQKGTVKWHAPISSDIPWDDSTFQLVAASHQIFLVLTDQVRSIDVQTHQAHWIWEAPFRVGHAFVADGLLYVLGDQGEVTALETSTGAVRWKWQVEGEIFRDWSTIDQGTLYIATTDIVYALHS